MGVFDQASRFATSAEPEFVLHRLQPLTGLSLRFRRWQETRGYPLPGGPDRDADLVAIADNPEESECPWLLIFECQTRHDADKPNVLQLEALIFLCYARDIDRGGGAFKPLPVFIYLKEECPGSTVEVQTPTGCGFFGKPALWEVFKDSAVEALSRLEAGEISWGVLFWVALMRGAHEEEVLATWRRLLEEKVPANRRADVGYISLLFAELAGCRIAFNRVLQGVTMTESAVYNEAVEVGAMEMARNALLQFLKVRLPEALTADVERAIRDQPSLGLLKDWLGAAYAARSGDEFLTVLRR